MHGERERTGWIIRTVFLSSCLFFVLKITHKLKYYCIDFIYTQMIIHAVHGTRTSLRKEAEMKNTAEV